VADHCIQIFNKDYHFIRKFGSPGSKPGQLSCPVGITINSKGEIIVSELSNNRLQVFDYDSG